MNGFAVYHLIGASIPSDPPKDLVQTRSPARRQLIAVGLVVAPDPDHEHSQEPGRAARPPRRSLHWLGPRPCLALRVTVRIAFLGVLESTRGVHGTPVTSSER